MGSGARKESDIISVGTAIGTGLNVTPLSIEIALDYHSPKANKEGEVTHADFNIKWIRKLLSGAAGETRGRVQHALETTSGALSKLEDHVATIDIAPTDIPIRKAEIDLPVAIGILSAADIIPPQALLESLIVGELSMTGAVRETTNAIALAILAKQKGIKNIYLPADSAKEAAVIPGVNIFPVATLEQLIRHFQESGEKIEPASRTVVEKVRIKPEVDFAEISGQKIAKRALEIAAAGGHNVLMSGPAGTGKSLLGKALAGILPDLTWDEMIEATQIHSIAGELSPEHPIITSRPVRTVHHSITAQGLIGGMGSDRSIKPGEISLAHHGVLFLDELAEFKGKTLEQLRQPLEDRRVKLARVDSKMTIPTDFILVAAMNLCPCGHHGELKNTCVCSPEQRKKYTENISGPVLDRIDMQIAVPPVDQKQHIISAGKGETSNTVRSRVEQARAIQRERLGDARTNATLSIKEIKKYCKLEEVGQAYFIAASKEHRLSARGVHRVLKMSRTIADLAGEPNITIEHLREAMRLRVPAEK